MNVITRRDVTVLIFPFLAGYLINITKLQLYFYIKYLINARLGCIYKLYSFI